MHLHSPKRVENVDFFAKLTVLGAEANGSTLLDYFWQVMLFFEFWLVSLRESKTQTLSDGQSPRLFAIGSYTIERERVQGNKLMKKNEKKININNRLEYFL